MAATCCLFLAAMFQTTHTILSVGHPPPRPLPFNPITKPPLVRVQRVGPPPSRPKDGDHQAPKTAIGAALPCARCGSHIRATGWQVEAGGGLRGKAAKGVVHTRTHAHTHSCSTQYSTIQTMGVHLEYLPERSSGPAAQTAAQTRTSQYTRDACVSVHVRDRVTVLPHRPTHQHTHAHTHTRTPTRPHPCRLSMMCSPAGMGCTESRYHWRPGVVAMPSCVLALGPTHHMGVASHASGVVRKGGGGGARDMGGGFGLLRNGGKRVFEKMGQAGIFPAKDPNSAEMAFGWPPGRK